MVRPLALLIVAAAVLLAPSVLAQNKPLYKWTDENGVTHYSDQKPEGIEYQQREVEPEPEPTESAPLPLKLDAPPSAECLQARINLDVLANAQAVSMDVDGDGVEETLDDATRAAELQKARAKVAQVCKSG